MTIGIAGRRRNGKSLLALILGIYISEKTEAPLLSNDQRTVETNIAEKLTYKKLMNAQRKVIIIDEFWRDMDSWNWKDPKSRLMTHWYQLQGHKDIIIIYTTQTFQQINNRIRNSTDYLIWAEKKQKGNKLEFVYTIMDGFTKQIIKTIKTNEERIRKFYKYYDYIGTVESIFNEKEYETTT